LEIILQESKKANYDLRCIHIPKTIDNDLVLNDHTPGFGSAARFVSQGFVGINLDNKSLGGVYIGIVMGRHAGFLTASSVLGKKYEDDGPHLVYLPERDFSIETFVNDVKDVYSKYGRCIVAISEGVCDSEGTPIAVKYCKEIERDSHGNLQLSGNGLLGDLLAHYIKNGLGIKRVRVDTFGYLQRSFIESVSDIDRMEAREIGEKAVQYAVIHDMNGSVAIKRIGDYDIEYRLEKLHLIAGKTKTMDESFINRDGNYVTEAFLKYCKPLIGRSLKEPYVLRAPKVEKILAKK
jgi:6-phosphofructokinase 1